MREVQSLYVPSCHGCNHALKEQAGARVVLLGILANLIAPFFCVMHGDTNSNALGFTIALVQLTRSDFSEWRRSVFSEWR